MPEPLCQRASDEPLESAALVGPGGQGLECLAQDVLGPVDDGGAVRPGGAPEQ